MSRRNVKKKQEAQKRLEAARRQRSAGASCLRALRMGHITVGKILESVPDDVGHCRVYDVLRATPKLNDDGAQHVLMEAKVWPLKRMRELTDEELRVIGRKLPARARMT